MVSLLGPYGAETAFLFCIAPVVFLATWTDLRTFKIPNALPLVGLAIFALTCMIFLPLAEIPGRLLGGLIVFLVCFILFSIRQMGGGDAKLLPVVALFVPGEDALAVAIMLAVSGLACLVLAGAVALTRRMSLSLDSPFWGEVSDWEIWSGGRHVPYALAMGATLALYLFLRLIG